MNNIHQSSCGEYVIHSVQNIKVTVTKSATISTDSIEIQTEHNGVYAGIEFSPTVEYI